MRRHHGHRHRILILVEPLDGVLEQDLHIGQLVQARQDELRGLELLALDHVGKGRIVRKQSVIEFGDL